MCISIVWIESQVVCGTQNGILAVYSWDRFDDMSDRFPGHPHSIDAIVKVDEDTIITGSSDGMLRVLSVHPNKLLGLLGEHDEYPIERLGTNESDRERKEKIHRTMHVYIVSDDQQLNSLRLQRSLPQSTDVCVCVYVYVCVCVCTSSH